jgi:hypothetical protein
MRIERTCATLTKADSIHAVAQTNMIRVIIPFHLRPLAHVGGNLQRDRLCHGQTQQESTTCS